MRKRADAIRPYRCKNLIAVIEGPGDILNIGTVIRNVNALGVEKAYIVDPGNALSDDWQDLRERKEILKTSVSAVKWTFVKRFDSTKACLDHLESNGFVSAVTSPHVKGKSNPGFPMWDRPNQESMVGKGLICKAFAFDGCRRANLVGRGLIGGRAGLKQAC